MSLLDQLLATVMQRITGKQPTLIKRCFEPAFFQEKTVQEEFVQNGYTVIRNVLTAEELGRVWQAYHEISAMPGFDVHQQFESTGNFKSRELQEYIFSFVHKLDAVVAPRFADLNNCEIGDGGTFFIKPPSAAASILHPHQDSAVIDERRFYGVFLWMPLQDIDHSNGPLYVLPKSHLWGNVQRSQHIPWAFRHVYKFLWQHMIPVPVKAGDIICFDTSLIHASGPNTSSNTRVAVCGALLPKRHEKVEFMLHGRSIRQYQVTDSYWLDGGLAENLHQFPFEESPYTYPNPATKANVKFLLHSF
ncbi:MAG: phytanoyl-CoA dioxygenase family protein [Chitinophagales bacterium]